MKYTTMYLKYKTMEPKMEMSKPTKETLKTKTMKTTETIGVKEMLDVKSILDKKIANYFGTGTKDPKDVGYLCLIKQAENINKHLIENNIDTNKTETIVEEPVAKRKQTKRVSVKSEPTGWGEKGYTGHSYGTSGYSDDLFR